LFITPGVCLPLPVTAGAGVPTGSTPGGVYGSTVGLGAGCTVPSAAASLAEF
jgi:outer membrane lipoprotein SlyB